MEDKQLNSVESIALIQRMIDVTREKYERGGGTAFLIFGYTSLVVGAIVGLLVHLTGNYYFNFLWWAIPVIGFPVRYFIDRGKPKAVQTYIETFISRVWLVLAVFLLLFPLVGVFSDLVNLMIIPFESLMLSIGILITGVTIKVKPIVLSGVVAAVLSFLMFFISTGYEYLFMAMFILGMIVPGHVLNYRAKRCSKN